MIIRTSYSVVLKKQINLNSDGLEEYQKIDRNLIESTAEICLEALKFCVSVYDENWEYLSAFPSTPKPGIKCRKRVADTMIHSTKNSKAMYPEFDEKFKYLPAYTRRAIMSDAVGMVSSYRTNLKMWEQLPSDKRGLPPQLGLPTRYELTFYEQERDFHNLEKGIIGLKLYDGKTWNWYYFYIGTSDAKHINELCKTRKLLSPTVQKIRGRYEVRFCFEEWQDLVQDENRLDYRIMAVDLGINAAATWCIMTADGTVHAKGVIHCAREEDHLCRMINRKRMYRQAGKKSHCVYRWLKAANRELSIATAKKIIDVAILYDVDCIVFEHLDFSGKIKGSKKIKKRLQLWRGVDVQKRVELFAHQNGMRISRVCAWNTSRLAFDGSGPVDRYSIYKFEHGEKVYNYSLCTFQSGKKYNCDLSAAQNIGARFFLREYQRLPECPELPSTPFRTLSTLKSILDAIQTEKIA